jgi:predicted negative regulator of RcsB-dependent stress response
LARKPEKPDALEELNTRVDQLAHWVVENRVPFMATLVAILVAAGGYGIYDGVTSRQELEAATALARLEADYRQAMGSEPDAAIVEEPANAELAERTRREYRESFQELAEEHSGTSAAVMARLEAGNRAAELGDVEGGLDSFRTASEEAAGDSALRGLVLVRLGRALEQEGRFAEAAEVFEQAGVIEAFPLRYHALGDAARNYANADDEGRAVALYRWIELEAPDVVLPEHVRSRLRELQARVSAPAADDS